MVALYDYTAQGTEDLEFSEGDTIDILGEGEALQVNLIVNDPSVESLKVFRFRRTFSLETFSRCFLLCSDVSLTAS